MSIFNFLSLSTLVSRLSSLDSRHSTFVSRLSSLDSHLSTLDSRLSTLVTRLSSLVSRLSSFVFLDVYPCLRFSLHAPASAYMSAPRPCFAQHSLQAECGVAIVKFEIFVFLLLLSPAIFGLFRIFRLPNIFSESQKNPAQLNSALCILHSALFKCLRLLSLFLCMRQPRCLCLSACIRRSISEIRDIRVRSTCWRSSFRVFSLFRLHIYFRNTKKIRRTHSALFNILVSSVFLDVQSSLALAQLTFDL